MSSKVSSFKLPIWLGTCLFGAIAVFFLWEEHSAHLLGALPYLFLLACPLMHLLMHRGHHHGPQHPESEGEANSQHGGAS